MTVKIRLVIFSVMLVLLGTSCWADQLRELSVELDGGIRQDSLEWNIAGVNNSPNILSELEWDDLEIYQLGLGSKLIVENNKVPFATYLRLKANYGWILDGDVQDSDYFGNNRTNEFSRSYSDSGDGDVLDLGAGIGFQFGLFNDHLLIAPLIGYSYHEQNLTMKDGVQAVGDGVLVPVVGTVLDDLDSSYDSEWQGPWIGVDVTWLLGQRLALEGTFEYHDVDYDAEADWNLRDDFAHPVSFAHEADGEGVVVEMALRYLLNESWALDAGVSYSRFETDSGDDRTFFSDGSSEVTKFNEVDWESFSSTIGVRYDFF